MSNQAVGNVYQTIINEVIDGSRVDFDESGVEESVLEELRQVRTASFHHPSQLYRSQQSLGSAKNLYVDGFALLNYCSIIRC